MKTTELFVEQTLTGFLVLTAAAAPFLSWDTLQKLPDEAQGGVDISSAAGAIGVAYLLGVVFDRFADTLLERFNRWNRLLFAIELKEENEALSPDDPFPEVSRRTRRDEGDGGARILAGSVAAGSGARFDPARGRSQPGRDGSRARHRRCSHRHFRLGLVEDDRDLHAVSSRLPEVGA